MVGVENRMREKLRSSAGDSGGGFRKSGSENFQEWLDAGCGFVERNGNRGFIEQAEIDSLCCGTGDQDGGGFVFWSHADRVKERSVMHSVAGLFKRLGEVCSMTMHAPGDGTQTLRTVINGIHRSHHGE